MRTFRALFGGLFYGTSMCRVREVFDILRVVHSARCTHGSPRCLPLRRFDRPGHERHCREANCDGNPQRNVEECKLIYPRIIPSNAIRFFQVGIPLVNCISGCAIHGIRSYPAAPRCGIVQIQDRCRNGGPKAKEERNPQQNAETLYLLLSPSIPDRQHVMNLQRHH